MEHDLNEAWAVLVGGSRVEQIVHIMSENRQEDLQLRLSRPSSPALIKMCLAYIAMKHMYERAVASQLQRDHDEPPYTKKPE